MPDTRPLGDIPLGFTAQASGQSAQVIQIDNGKAIAAVGLCAAICGICAAVTVVTVWHSKEREVSTEAQYRKTQNHVDEMTNELKRLRDRLEDKDRAN